MTDGSYRLYTSAEAQRFLATHPGIQQGKYDFISPTNVLLRWNGDVYVGVLTPLATADHTLLVRRHTSPIAPGLIAALEKHGVTATAYWDANALNLEHGMNETVPRGCPRHRSAIAICVGKTLTPHGTRVAPRAPIRTEKEDLAFALSCEELAS